MSVPMKGTAKNTTAPPTSHSQGLGDEGTRETGVDPEGSGAAGRLMCEVRTAVHLLSFSVFSHRASRLGTGVHVVPRCWAECDERTRVDEVPDSGLRAQV